MEDVSVPRVLGMEDVSSISCSEATRNEDVSSISVQGVFGDDRGVGEAAVGFLAPAIKEQASHSS